MTFSKPASPGSPPDDVSRWDGLLWEQELDYEVRTLKLMTRFVREEHNRILCGDKSGRITTFHLDGTPAWATPLGKGQGDRPIGGPVYDLVIVHPLQDATTPLDLDRHHCLIVVGAGNGQLSFRDYLSGEAAVIELEEGPGAHLDLGSSILSLLYIESCHELWIGLASGEIARLFFEFSPTVARSRRLPSLDLGEAVSAFCFMPRSEDRSGDGYRQGWVCAATMLGNVYSIDPFTSPPSVQERLLQTTGPIRSCVSLSQVASKHGWKRSDVFAVACGGAVKYFIREWPEEGRPGAREAVLDWPCADRVFCLAWTDLKDTVWLVVGANDRRLHFCRVMSKKGVKEGRSPSHCFGDKRFSIRLPERVREVAVREVPALGGDEAEANLYVALGNHQIRALHLLSQGRFRKRIEDHLTPSDLQDILKRLSEAPHDPLLWRQIIALLFRAGWLSKYLVQHPLDAAGKRCLRLIVYHLLAHSGPLTCREIQSGILEAANECREFRVTATELARHISKYCLDGFSFSDKTRNLDRLARFNEKNRGDYLFDAAIYRSLLAERRHTERAIFELDEPVTSLQAVELHALGGRRLLATSYEKGVAWLIEKGDRPRIRIQSFDGERPLEWLQRIIVWTDPASRTQHAVFFYRHQGWTSCLLDRRLEKEEKVLPPPRPVPGAESFFIYSFQELPGGVIAAGGRCADVCLLRITSGDGGRTVDLCASAPLRATEQEYAPVWALCFRPLDGDAGELLAGCDNGVCYRFPVQGEALEEPRPVYQPEAPVGGAIRVLVPLGRDHLVLGDATDSLALLRRLDSSFAPEWTARLGAAVTGAVQTTLWVPNDDELAPSPPARRVFIVSDSLGKFHVVRPDIRQHSFAEPLVGSGSSPIEQMVLLPPDDEETEPRDEAQVAVACFDQTVRILRIVHRRESVRHLNNDLAQAVIATLREALPNLPAAALTEAETELRVALDQNLFVPDIVRTVVGKLAPASANARELARLEQEVRGSFDEVAWKLASVNVRSESTAVMSLRLRYDDPEAFNRLLNDLDALPSGAIKGPQGKRPHLRLRYLLRFAFKIVAHFLEDEEPPNGALKRSLARFVHLCHNLCQRWGSDQSDDELLCKLFVSHMLFRFATRRTLNYLLGNDLTEDLAEITGRSMTDFVQERLLNGPRLGIPFRTVQHIRRMVEHDKSGDLNEPVKNYLVPLLVNRFRQCQGMPHDAWLGMELYLCLSCIESKYRYSQWSLVSNLLEDGLSLRLLDFLAERQRVIPPSDSRCRDVVEALSRAEGVSAGEPGVAEARMIVFDLLDGNQGRRGILACVRFLTAVAITFDSSSDPDLRTRARMAIEQVHLEALSLPPSVSRGNMVQLLDCALGLIRLSTSLSSEDRRALYHSLRESLEGLIALGLPSSPEVGALDLDVVRKIFLEAREFVRRQVEIEFDFVAPLRFLQEHSFAGDEIADEQMLGEKLLSYADLQGDLSRSRTTLLLSRDATERVVVLNVLGEQSSRETLPSRTQIRRRLKTLLPAPLEIDLFEQEAVRLLDFEPGTDGALRPDLFELGPDLLGEIIPINREGELYGLLFFAYPRDLAPDPSKRALARMVPQLLVMEFMRSVQTQRFLSLIFHHISAPIAAMRVMLHSLTAGYIEPEERAKYFENLWYMAEDCRLMIENHQKYVRMVRGMALPALPTRFDIAAEAEFRRKIVHYKYKGSQQTVRWTSPPESLEVYLDRTMVGDIIQNLLDNACKYSPARSEIRLSLQGRRKEVFIEVNDQGPGLPEEVSASLYGEGVRGEAAARSSRPGLGLGLYMVRRYVERLNGDIWYDSSPRGTTFTVRLPREV
jgi:signal transduction histidine kinase